MKQLMKPTYKMKNLKIFTIVFALFALAFQANAQGNKGGRKARHEKIDAAKTAYLTDRMNLSTEQSQKFWPLYNEYDAKRQQIRKKSRALKEENLEAMSDADLKAGINDMMEGRQQELNLEKEYLEKFQKVISVRQVATMYKAEKEFMKVLLKKLNDDNPK